MAPMPLTRGREVQGKQQVVLFRSTGGECGWMDLIDARRVLAERPAEWSKEPFVGQTYGAPKDPHFVEVQRNGGYVGAIEHPSGW